MVGDQVWRLRLNEGCIPVVCTLVCGMYRDDDEAMMIFLFTFSATSSFSRSSLNTFERGLRIPASWPKMQIRSKVTAVQIPMKPDCVSPLFADRMNMVATNLSSAGASVPEYLVECEALHVPVTNVTTALWDAAGMSGLSNRKE